MATFDFDDPQPAPHELVPTSGEVGTTRADLETYKPADIYGQLTQYERAFVEAYMVDFNGTQAIKDAGYKGNYASQAATRMMQMVRVAQAIEHCVNERGLRTQITSDMVVRQLGILGTSDIGNYVIDDMGHVSLHEEAPWDAMAAVSSIKRSVRVDAKDDDISVITTEIRLWDKNTALGKLMQHLGMDRKGHNPDAPLGSPENPLSVQHTWEIGGRKVSF